MAEFGPSAYVTMLPHFTLKQHTILMGTVQRDNNSTFTVRWSENAFFAGGEAIATSDDPDKMPKVLELMGVVSPSHLFMIKVDLPINDIGDLKHTIESGGGIAIIKSENPDGFKRTAPTGKSIISYKYDTRLPKPTFQEVQEVFTTDKITLSILWNVPIAGFNDSNFVYEWSSDSYQGTVTTSEVPNFSGDVSLLDITFPLMHKGTLKITIKKADLLPNENDIIDGLIFKDGANLIDGLATDEEKDEFYAMGKMAVDAVLAELSTDDNPVETISQLKEILLDEDHENYDPIRYAGLIIEPTVNRGVSRTTMPYRAGPKSAVGIEIEYDTLFEAIQPTYGDLNLHISNRSTFLGTDQTEILGYYLEDEFGRLRLPDGSVLTQTSDNTFSSRNGHLFREGDITFDNNPYSGTFLKYFRALKNNGGFDGDPNSPVTPDSLMTSSTWEHIEPFQAPSVYLGIVFTWTSPTSVDVSDINFKEVINFQYNDIQIIQYKKLADNDIYVRKEFADADAIEDAVGDEAKAKVKADAAVADIVKLYRTDDDITAYTRDDSNFDKWAELASRPNVEVPRVIDTNLNEAVPNIHEIVLKLPADSIGVFEVLVGTQNGQSPTVVGVETVEVDPMMPDAVEEPKEALLPYLIRTKRDHIPVGEENPSNGAIPRAVRDRRNRTETNSTTLATNDSPGHTITSGPIYFDTTTNDEDFVAPEGITVETILCIDRNMRNNEILNNRNTQERSTSYHSNTHQFTMPETMATEADRSAGGGFAGVSDSIKNGNNMYFVTQIQRRDPQDKHGISEVFKGAAALCHVDLSSTPDSMRVLKTYLQVEDAARSLTLHQGKVYFFEGSHYQYHGFSGFNRRDTDTDLYNNFNTGNLYMIDDSNSDDIRLEYKAGGWQSDVTVTDEIADVFRTSADPDIGPYLPHDSTASPLVSTEPKTSLNPDAEINMITGAGNMDDLIEYISKTETEITENTDFSILEFLGLASETEIEIDFTVLLTPSESTTADINNWNWIRYARTIEQRISHFHTNKQKPFDLIKQLAQLTNSIMGFQAVIDADGKIKNLFFMKPRDPYTGLFNGIKPAVEGQGNNDLYYIENNRDFSALHPADGSTRLILINNELIGYNRHYERLMSFGNIIRGYSGTTVFEHRERDKFIYIDHILDLELSAYDPPITELKYRDDSGQLYNQVEIQYGITEDFTFRQEKYASIQMNSEQETSFEVPLDRHQLPWIEYLAEKFLERNKDMKYLITLVLKPTYYLNLGQSVLIRQRWRDKDRDGWHIFLAAQVYDISHSFDDNTTTCIFRTI